MFDFALHLKELRQSRNLTQKQLAEAIHASERGIQNYEMGIRKPTYEMLIALADYFNVSIDYLVGRAGAPKMDITVSLDVKIYKQLRLIAIQEKHSTEAQASQCLTEYVKNYLKVNELAYDQYDDCLVPKDLIADF